MAKIHDELEAAKTEADRVIHDDNATPQVTAVIAKIDAVQPKLDNAISLLHDKENNSELVEAKRQLDEASRTRSNTRNDAKQQQITIERKSRSRTKVQKLKCD